MCAEVELVVVESESEMHRSAQLGLTSLLSSLPRSGHSTLWSLQRPPSAPRESLHARRTPSASSAPPLPLTEEPTSTSQPSATPSFAGTMPCTPLDKLPPELLERIVDLAVEGWPSTLRLRASTLCDLSLVARAWVGPAQRALESRVHIDSYTRARAFLERPRTLERPLVLDELVLFFDFAPQDDTFYPLSDLQVLSLCRMDAQIRSLHLRSTLFMASFDLNLLRLPSFRGEPSRAVPTQVIGRELTGMSAQGSVTSGSTCPSKSPPTSSPSLSGSRGCRCRPWWTSPPRSSDPYSSRRRTP